jgi:pyrroloquinoline-quinone synthase
MSPSSVNSGVTAALVDRRLLEHPFYRRWEHGEVSMDELADYAAQYRHFERYLPVFLKELVVGLPEGSARELVAANLADEEGDPVPHVDLFERFARAVGAEAAIATPAMAELLGTYGELLDEAPAAALAGFLAYESQASDVARRKADGLRRHHGLDDHAVSFWEHHAEIDARHGAWAQRAFDECTDEPVRLVPFARQAADAWWTFLDEREAVAKA